MIWLPTMWPEKRRKPGCREKYEKNRKDERDSQTGKKRPKEF